ncbi:hypothetical protein QAD02_018620 [Eretmocerus hayati]|uniref:Uncharacterized protein n=1 Tax=Eretmocerus hayati TaxID=131215 RepID=A0ACC2PIG7_9HYME|nr:hypothetical protein QAD02_018620 [Eretmocerus hayati]
MDIDENLFINFIPLISAGILTLVTFITIVIKLRNRWPVRVNCWFCDSNAQIHRQSLNWWLCPQCEQYNGFSEDGDYRFEIPEQHELQKKGASNNKWYCQKSKVSTSKYSLCRECNRREELKLSKLRELEDSADLNNDEQIARFERTFEKKYPLCSRCQNVVQRVLCKQTLWLTQYKMLLFKQKPIKRIIESREKIEKVLRVALLLLASMSIHSSDVWYFPLCGIVLQIITCLVCQVNQYSNLLLVLGWACLLGTNEYFAGMFDFDSLLPDIESSPVTDSSRQHFVVALGSVIGIANLKFRYHKTITNEYLQFKKLETPNVSAPTSRSPTPEITEFTLKKTTCNEQRTRSSYSPVNITSTIMNPSAVETPIPLKPFNPTKRSLVSNVSESRFLQGSNSSSLETSFSRNSPVQAASLNDSLNSLNSLSLGSGPRSSSSSQSPNVFETKVYGTTSPDIFCRRKPPILAPPKLRSLTQISWVAGGYWQSGLDIHTLSRSSSQSSGFGSTASNYGRPSREPSVQDFDRCSVLSDSCFATPESPIWSKSSHSAVKNDSLSSSSESIDCCSKRETKCSGHTTTIVTNPSWLPVLLCSSLIFNMAVVCTLLLR